VLVAAGLYLIPHDALTLSRGLFRTAFPLLMVAAGAGVLALLLLRQRKFEGARVLAAAAVFAVITAWGVGQYPWMLVDQMSIRDAAGAGTTLAGLLVVVALAAVIVLPALAYLLWFAQTYKSAHRQNPASRPGGRRR
jgi:cytochrome d ubiquinol oxidase subunit II